MYLLFRLSEWKEEKKTLFLFASSVESLNPPHDYCNTKSNVFLFKIKLLYIYPSSLEQS